MIDDRTLLKFYMALSARKREVVEVVSRGMSNKAAANYLSIEAVSVADSLTFIYGRMESLEEFNHIKPNRALLISVFAPFFDRHPEMRNDTLLVK
jgi:hypothetical protein